MGIYIKITCAIIFIILAYFIINMYNVERFDSIDTYVNKTVRLKTTINNSEYYLTPMHNTTCKNNCNMNKLVLMTPSMLSKQNDAMDELIKKENQLCKVKQEMNNNSTDVCNLQNIKAGDFTIQIIDVTNNNPYKYTLRSATIQPDITKFSTAQYFINGANVNKINDLCADGWQQNLNSSKNTNLFAIELDSDGMRLRCNLNNTVFYIGVDTKLTCAGIINLMFVANREDAVIFAIE